MVLKLYFDLISAPSRAVYIFFRAAKVPFEPVPVALRQGAHKLPEFLKINRFGRVPAIQDDGFNLSESVAIFRYVARKYPVDDHWYPKDSIAQARVDEFLEWHHIDLQDPCANIYRIKIIAPRMTGKDPNPEMLEKSIEALKIALDNVEKNWLGDDKPFLNGNKICVADILTACELEDPRMAGYDPVEGRPNLAKWLERARSELSPHYKEAHVWVNKFNRKTLIPSCEFKTEGMQDSSS